MIAAIMQPYFFPYLGYFQLMEAVDVFVFYDDAQYITRGWVNRNRIRSGNASTWLTLPVVGASARLPINQRRYLLEPGVPRVKNQLHAAYRKSPRYAEVAPVIHDLLGFADPGVGVFNANILGTIGRRLGVECVFMQSSDIDVPAEVRGSDRIIAICRRIGASSYLNPIGGMDLYDGERFRANGLGLAFLKTNLPPAQLDNVPGFLSVLDPLMQEGFTKCAEQLRCYELVDEGT